MERHLRGEPGRHPGQERARRRNRPALALNDPVGRLLALRARESLVVVGLMSGTSADGVDAAAVRIARDDPASGRLDARLLAFAERPYQAALQRRILDAAGAGARDLAGLDADLGDAFADAALAAIAACAPEPVHLIGSHGQTIVHEPRRAPGATLQIGQAARIAERTGLPVVSDFRARDVALGGEGAPLVPLVDRLLFAHPGETRALLNLGGIANVTVVAPEPAALVAFDVGPANAAMDALVRIGTGGEETCDRDGRRAARGRVRDDLLAEALRHPHFARPFPKSLDREAFGAALARAWFQRAGGGASALDDLVATASALTVEAIGRALAEHSIARVIASGGGTRNPILMEALGRRIAPIPLDTTDAHGIPSQAKEAIAFAVLARETLFGRPGNVPAATGARRPAVLGTITP